MLRELDLPMGLSSTIPVVLRRAESEDCDAIVRLLADDPISGSRGDVAAPEDDLIYAAALAGISLDAGNELVVVEDDEGRIVGTFQLTRIPGMARRGATRLLVEAVRVSSDVRSGGIGTAMMRWVLDVAAPVLGVELVQLTSDAARVQAHHFYERLGFTASHVGFKYRLGLRG